MCLEHIVEQCPLCKAPASMLEHLTRGYYCACCGQVMELDAEGRVTKRSPTQHAHRVIDCQGHIIDDWS